MTIRLVLLVLTSSFLSALAAWSAPAHAQSQVVLLLPSSTRSAAMADAFGIGTIDSDAVFYNAAFNDRLRGAGTSIAWYGDVTVYTISAGTDWLGGAIGLGVQALGYRQSDLGFSPVSPAASLFAEFGPDVSERAIALAYGRRIKGVRLAVTAKHLEQRIPRERDQLVLADVATGITVSSLNVGLAAQNLGRSSYVSDGILVDVPYRALLNAGTTRSYPLGPLDVAGSAAVSYVRDRKVIPAAGVELAYWPVPGRTFFLRAGVRRPDQAEKPFTVGAGFAGDKIILDYALEPFDAGWQSHRFGVKWR